MDMGWYWLSQKLMFLHVFYRQFVWRLDEPIMPLEKGMSFRAHVVFLRLQHVWQVMCPPFRVLRSLDVQLEWPWCHSCGRSRQWQVCVTHHCWSLSSTETSWSWVNWSGSYCSQQLKPPTKGYIQEIQKWIMDIEWYGLVRNWCFCVCSIVSLFDRLDEPIMPVLLVSSVYLRDLMNQSWLYRRVCHFETM